MCACGICLGVCFITNEEGRIRRWIIYNPLLVGCVWVHMSGTFRWISCSTHVRMLNGIKSRTSADLCNFLKFSLCVCGVTNLKLGISRGKNSSRRPQKLCQVSFLVQSIITWNTFCPMLSCRNSDNLVNGDLIRFCFGVSPVIRSDNVVKKPQSSTNIFDTENPRKKFCATFFFCSNCHKVVPVWLNKSSYAMKCSGK